MNAPQPTPAVAVPAEAEPLAPVLGLGGRDNLVLLLAVIVALGAHGTAGSRVFRSFPYLVELAQGVRKGMHDRFHSQVDIAEDKPPPPPPPPPEPVKEPEPPPPAARAAPPPPEAAKPPAAAEAGKILTAEPDPDEPVDLTGDGFVSGSGDRFAGGVTASSGTAKTAVRNAAASPTGTGTGTQPAAPSAPAVNLSRPAGLGSSLQWNCGFPPEADAEGINFKRVQVVVTVKADGTARSVTVVQDPGFGFGPWARKCALRNTYTPALNAAGQPIEQTIPFSIKFQR
jgi:periplasmic protein TonB